MLVNGFLNRLACVGLILILVFPLGQQLFPLVAHAIDGLQYGVIETVITTALGSGLYAALFG